jgi:hydroxyacylglutathione hydrolase
MTMKKILLAFGILVAVPLIAIVALFATREPPDGPRVEAEPGVVGIEAGGAYAWIVRTPHGAVLVDAGLDNSGTAILRELRSEGVSADAVQAVLITHGHPDHYSAAGLFRKAVVLLGAGDLAMVRGDPSHYSTFGKMIAKVMPRPPVPVVTTMLRGGEQLDFDGGRFDVIATPGHSPGSVMYLYKDVLFSGDSLMREKDRVAIAPSLFSEDAAQNRASLQKLGPLAFEKLADGHTGVTSDARAKLRRFLAGT